MINVHLPQAVTSKRTTLPVRRASPRAFWILFAVEGVLIATILFLLLRALTPAHTPLVQGTDYATVREAIWSRLNGVTADPLLEVAPGVTARSSAVRGFALNGQTYYYYLEGRRGFDPLSRGVIARDDVEIVLRDTEGPYALVIYRLLER